MKRYLVNEIFYSLQGEGMNAGIPMIFVRFAKCNLSCSKAVEGFDCDTDFAHGLWYDLSGLVNTIKKMGPAASWVLFTGGEPSLQLDERLIDAVHDQGRRVAIETNGTRRLPAGIDWVCVSPKPGAPLQVTTADEFKFVMNAEMALPDRTGLKSTNFLLSPAANGDVIDPDALVRCIALVETYPLWRLSCQQHKFWGIR